MLKAVILFLILFFTFTSSAQSAREISITSDKNTLSLDQEIIALASAAGFTNGEKIYIKGAFYKDGSTDYFGFTRFNDFWIKNSVTARSQKEATVGDWDNSVVVKIDYDDSGFIRVGDYKFKLGFYYLTSSGNTSSVNWSENSLDLKIDNQLSPSLQPEKNSASKVINSSAEVNVVNTPTPKQNPTVSSATAKKNTESVKITNIQREASGYAKIEPITKISDKEEDDVQVLGAKDQIFPKVYLTAGVLLIIISSFILLKRELRGRKII